jgi:hypothetical protein
MPDLPESDEPAHRFDDIMRGLPARLVDDEDSVNRWRLWCPWHFVS